MAIYKTIDLLNKLHEIIEDKYEYVDVMELDADDDTPEALAFDVFDDYDSSIDYEEVDSVDIPDDYDYSFHIHGKSDDNCYTISFTYEELFIISDAISDALEYYKKYISDPSCTRDERDNIKSFSVKCRNLQAKLAKFFKHLSVH